MEKQVSEVLAGGKDQERPDDAERYVVNTLEKLKYSVNKLCKYTSKLQEKQEEYDQFHEDCDFVRSRLPVDEKYDVRTAFMNFMKQKKQHDYQTSEPVLMQRVEAAENKVKELEKQLAEMQDNSSSSKLQKKPGSSTKKSESLTHGHSAQKSDSHSGPLYKSSTTRTVRWTLKWFKINDGRKVNLK